MAVLSLWSWNMKSSGKRSRFHFTCSISRFVSTPLLLLQQAEEFIAIDASVGENAAERPTLDVLGVDRDRDDVAAIGMAEVMMAALGTSKAPALLLQNPNQLPGSNPRQPTTHAATVTRSISAG